MNNSVSDRSLYIESEEEDEFDEEGKDSDRGDDAGNDSDSSDSSIGSHHHNRPSSYNTTWPQSYRQSIDMYSSVASPNIGFLGTPTLTRLGSSFLSSSLQRRHTPEILSSLIKPILPTVQDQQQHTQSSQSLIPRISSRRSSHRKIHDHKPSKVSHELPTSHECNYGQAVLNGINVLCGVGILSTPYAVKEGGWLGLMILLMFATIAWYTGILLRDCLESEPGLETYPDIGQAAFGTTGRLAISIILYVELYACCVEYIILEGDNLASLFPNAHLSFAGLELTSNVLFSLLTTVTVLPTVWLRDLSVLSYLSAGGVIASILVFVCLFWVGLVDKVGFQQRGSAFNLVNFPVSIGLYGYCYSGHAVFPNIYTSMKKRSQFPSVLFASFAFCTILYAGCAATGYTMFGESIKSQFTLNMPQDLVASKIAVWTTVVNPFTKFALTISPVALSFEELIPSNHQKSHVYAIMIRTTLVLSTLVVALSVPFFGFVMALVGSLLTMLVTLILPCACYLSILRGKVSRIQTLLCMFIIAVGIACSVVGTISALERIVENFK